MCGIIIVGQGVAQVIISIQEELNMKNCKLLNLKNMKETVVNYSGDQKEFDKYGMLSTRWLVSALSVGWRGLSCRQRLVRW